MQATVRPSSLNVGLPKKTNYQLNVPFHYPPAAEVTEIEVTDPRHPLFGRRFEVFSLGTSARNAGFVTVIYRDSMRLQISLSATDLAPARQGPVSKFTLAAVTELVTLAQQGEWLCLSPPKPSGSGSPRSGERASSSS